MEKIAKDCDIVLIVGGKKFEHPKLHEVFVATNSNSKLLLEFINYVTDYDKMLNYDIFKYAKSNYLNNDF